MSGAQQLLDQVQSLTRIADLEAEPRAYAEHLAAELGAASTIAELDARDERLRLALAAIDTATERFVRIRLDHALAADTSIAAPTRKVFAATVLSYAGKVDVLETRARDIAARSAPATSDQIAAMVGDAARRTLALRDAVREPVLGLTARLAGEAVPAADTTARDRRLDEATRRTWSAVRRDLEAIANQPESITTATATVRRAAWPDQLDDPDPALEPTFADLLEMD